MVLDIYDHWGNLVNTAAAFLEIKKNEDEKWDKEMQLATAKRVAALEEIIERLQQFPKQELLVEKIRQSLGIVEQLSFNKKQLEDPAERERYQKNLTHLLKIYAEKGTIQ